MSPVEHIQAAEDSIQKAEDMDDPVCALSEAQIAQAHLLAAGMKLIVGLFSKGKRPADMLNMGLTILKMAR